MIKLDLTGLGATATERYGQWADDLKDRRPNTITHYFPETDFRLGHEGLAAIAEAKGIKLDNLKVGQFLLYTNRACTAVKLLTAGNIVVHQHAPKNMRIIYSAIRMLPYFFNGRELDLQGAIEKAVRTDHDQHVWRKSGVTRVEKK